MYHVQIGAYSVKKNADKQLAKAKKAGFKDAFVKYE
ncbi:SPOR domain-containing protein [Geobacillus thermodenitrificans]|nr:SPOR domain-containing protein [Geobacillus thermodenitrificans]